MSPISRNLAVRMIAVRSNLSAMRPAMAEKRKIGTVNIEAATATRVSRSMSNMVMPPKVIRVTRA